jgi:P27 family predicted phage terminase small subunit
LPPGRRPTPTAIKKLTGNPGHRALNEREPQPVTCVPKCPQHLDKEARKEWRRITPELQKLQVLTLVDRAALAAYCMAWSRWIDAEVNLRKFGTVIKTPLGYPIQNPYLAIANTAIDTMRRFLIEFGMTPSSRSRVSAVQVGPGMSSDPWDQLEAPTPAPEVNKVQ